MWTIRFWLAHLSLWFALWVMPRGPYHTELISRVYSLKHEAMAALKQQAK
jgi:hypothetical protein